MLTRRKKLLMELKGTVEISDNLKKMKEKLEKDRFICAQKTAKNYFFQHMHGKGPISA